MKRKNYKIFYGGGQDNQMRMVYSVYKKSTFLFFKYWSICIKNNVYAEFETYSDAQKYLKTL